MIPWVRILALPHVFDDLARPQFPFGEVDSGRTGSDAPYDILRVGLHNL